MRFFGSIAYEWRGTVVRAVASPDRGPLGVPEAIVSLLADRVLVCCPPGGTAHVPWDAVRDLRGWCPIASEARR